MPEDLIIKPRGLATDPNPHTAPDGSADVANNVIFRRDGIVEPRPGIGGTNGFTSPSSWDEYAPRRMISYNGDLYVVLDSDVGSIPNRALVRLGDTTITRSSPLGGGNVIWDPPYYNYEVFKGNLYLVTLDGIVRLRGTSTTADLAGLPCPPPAVAFDEVQETGAPFDDGDGAVYRATFVTTVGLQTIESPPSPRFFYDNFTGSAAYPGFKIYLPHDASTEWRVRLYRSRIIAMPQDNAGAALVGDQSGDFGDELFLVGEYDIAAGDITNGFVRYMWDTTEDIARGAALYTNATQQGIAKAKWSPPKARVIKEYNRMMFYANIASDLPATKSIPFACRRGTHDLDYTNASNSVTDGGSTEGDWTGIVLSESGVYPGDAGTYIDTAVVTSGPDGTSSITMDVSATATGAGVTTVLWNWISADGSDKVFYSVDPTVGGVLIGDDTAGLPSDHNVVAVNSSSEAYVAGSLIGYAQSAFDPSVIIDGTFPADGLSAYMARPSQSGKTMTGRRMSNVFEAGDAESFSVEMESNSLPGRIYFSQPDEPEAVPLLNFIDVGDVQCPILALARTRDSLFIFKTDGTWRLTGKTPEQIQLVEYDRTLKALHPQCVVEHESRIYLWSNQGLVQLTEAGWQSISDPYIDFETWTNNQIFSVLQDKWTGQFDVPGPRLCLWQAEDYIMLGIPQLVVDTRAPDRWFCFSTKTGQWSTWSFELHDCDVYTIDSDSATGDLYYLGIDAQDSTDYPFALKASWDNALEALPGDPNVTLSDKTDNGDGTFTFTFAGGVRTVQAGDAFASMADNDPDMVVTAVDGSSVTLRTLQDELSNGVAAHYKGMICTYYPRIRSAKNPTVSKHWQDMLFAFDSLRGTDAITAVARGDISANAGTLKWTATTEEFDLLHIPRSLRFGVPRVAARCTVMRPGIIVIAPWGRWMLTSIGLTYRPISFRVGR